MAASAPANIKTRTRDFLARLWDERFVPRPLRWADEWAEQERRLSSEESDDHGPYRIARTPYARFILRLLSPRSLTRVVSFMAPAQVTKTECGINAIGHRIDDHPCRIMLLMPTIDMAKDYVRDRFEPMVEGCPSLRARVPRVRSRDAQNTKLHKKFPGGSIRFRGANVPWALRSIPIQMLVEEEYDALARSLKAEGSASGIAEARLRRARRPKIYRNSTPTVAGVSPIALALRDSEACFEYRVACPHCGLFQVLRWEQVRYEVPPKREDGGKLQSIPGVWVACIGCTGRIEEREKYRLAREAEAHGEHGWHAVWEIGRQSVGIDGSSLALLAEQPWGVMAAKYERGREDPEAMREFYNLDLGRPYEEGSDAPQAEDLYARREPYPAGIVPEGVRILVAGVDVQPEAGWLAVEVVGYGRNMESWSIDYRVIPGDTSDPAGGAWAALVSQVLAVEWPCAGGGTLPIRCMAIDSGHQAEQVYAFARQHPAPTYGRKAIAIRKARTVMVIKGTDDWDMPLKLARKVSQTEKVRGLKVVGVGGSYLRHSQYRWLKRSPLTAEQRAAGEKEPRGVCHFPDAPQYSKDFFDELTAAEIRTEERHGFKRLRIVKPKHKRHEAGDCRVYARAAATACGIEQYTESDWRRVEASVPVGLVGHVATAPVAVEGGASVPPSRVRERSDVMPERPMTVGPPAPTVVTNRPGRRITNSWMGW
jgi:phage terminase large subunit GpA-like protein